MLGVGRGRCENKRGKGHARVAPFSLWDVYYQRYKQPAMGIRPRRPSSSTFFAKRSRFVAGRTSIGSSGIIRFFARVCRAVL